MKDIETKTAYITSQGGTLVAEVDGVKYWETADVCAKYRYCFGEMVDIEWWDGMDGWEVGEQLAVYAEQRAAAFEAGTGIDIFGE